MLCIGAHSDDIEIGCGGTISRIVEQHPGVQVHWVVFTSAPERDEEARAGAARLLAGAENSTVEIGRHRERYLPYEAVELKESFDRLGSEVDPDIIFTHYREDLHQDHRILSELTYNTFRQHLVLEYEIPKYDGDLGRPNVYVPIEESHRRRKIDTLMEAFGSQTGKYWFTADTFDAVLRLRGVEARSPTGLAEGFHCRKLLLS
jgi:LmbE family N-acetylglucosaminyl deacetylase